MLSKEELTVGALISGELVASGWKNWRMRKKQVRGRENLDRELINEKDDGHTYGKEEASVQ